MTDVPRRVTRGSLRSLLIRGQNQSRSRSATDIALSPLCQLDFSKEASNAWEPKREAPLRRDFDGQLTPDSVPVKRGELAACAGATVVFPSPQETFL